MSGVTITGKDNDKNKYVCSSYRIAFDGKGESKFGNDLVRNVIISVFIIVHHPILITARIIS